MFATIEDLRSQLGGTPVHQTPEYRAKMLHALPPVRVVNREAFILEHVKGKRVVEFGASGALHDAVVEVATSVFGVDREDAPGVRGFDLDDVRQTGLPLPTPLNIASQDRTVTAERAVDHVDVILCGEVLEHLSNPGWFLTRLRSHFEGVPVIVTVPNAFTASGAKWIARGFENVNLDHVAWYSPKTLATLLQRAGYVCADLYFYNGDGATAEGLIVVAE